MGSSINSVLKSYYAYRKNKNLFLVHRHTSIPDESNSSGEKDKYSKFLRECIGNYFYDFNV